MNALTQAPSTTVTWAFLSGVGASIIWELLDTFTEIEPTLGLVSGSAIFVSSFVGKLVKEKRYKMTERK